MSSFATNAVCAHQPLCADELMEETVKVINQALHDSGGREVASDISPLSEKISNGGTLRVRVLSAEDMLEKGAAILRFEADRVKLLQPDSCPPADGSTMVCEEHLLEVSSHPDVYVKDPLKLELLWVKDRMTVLEVKS